MYRKQVPDGQFCVCCYGNCQFRGKLEQLSQASGCLKVACVPLLCSLTTDSVCEHHPGACVSGTAVISLAMGNDSFSCFACVELSTPVTCVL